MRRLQLQLLHLDSESRRNFFPRGTTRSGDNFLLGVGGLADAKPRSDLVLRQLACAEPFGKGGTFT
jgi:hypothetical protein